MKHSVSERREDWRSGGFGLYVHWPFCESKCPYCDFNSHVAKTIHHGNWRDAYVREIERVAALVPGRILDSLFFGGGTPSTMEPETVQTIIDAARKAWTVRNSVEITLEANPSSVEYHRFADFAAAGVNRVSLGVQALDDASLRLLGRRHTVKEAMQAWDTAASVFDRRSFDLIYARQDQDQLAWQNELRQALALNPSHVSLYQLTIEEGTAFGDRYALGKLRGLPSEDLGADLYELTQEICNKAGLQAYEVSNHAIPGEESCHNMIYWRYGDYVGIGPGAHGRLSIDGQRVATESVKSPGAWLQSVRSGSDAHETAARLSNEDQASEYLMMSLRLREGSDLSRYLQIKGSQQTPDKLESLVADGFLWRDGQRFGTTEKGCPVLNSVLRELL